MTYVLKSDFDPKLLRTDKDPKGAFAEYVTTGTLGRFEGFLAALWKAA